MKRYRVVSHGDDQLLQPASQKRKQSDTRDDHEVTPNQESQTDTNRPNDGRLCLLSLVCDQHLSNKTSKKSQEGQAQAPSSSQGRKCTEDMAERNKRKEALVGVLKNAEEVLGAVVPVVIAPSEEENADVSNVSCDGPSHISDKVSTSQEFSSQKPALISKEDGAEQEENKESSSIWKEVCRPVPLPPRLPMVPAGFVFQLYKPPNVI